jgi:flavin reductase (DIM6/NTAB) family NADH-FMN oxidoreductase RutF/DNA-binding MarR family transcriptional regulator
MMKKISSPIHDIDPASDSRAFRRCLGQFSTGVTVITVASGDGFVGMTANSFSSVSLDPPLILWSIDRTSSRFAPFDQARHFVVNILSESQVGLARHFGSAGPDKFNDVGWSHGRNGAPILHDVAAFFECRRVGEYAGGDHMILIGEVERAALFDRPVLLFSQGRFRIPSDHPDDTIVAQATTADPSSPASSILFNLFQADHRLSAEFSRYRPDLTRDQHRVLIALERRPEIDLESLMEETFLGRQATEDALARLLADGSIIKAPDGRLSLSELGCERRRVLMDHLRKMEAEFMKDIPLKTQEAAQQVLARLIGRG